MGGITHDWVPFTSNFLVCVRCGCHKPKETEDTKPCKLSPDMCRNCLKPADRVYSQPNDSQGEQDVYVCEACDITWPTEWSKSG